MNDDVNDLRVGVAGLCAAVKGLSTEVGHMRRSGNAALAAIVLLAIIQTAVVALALGGHYSAEAPGLAVSVGQPHP